MVRLADQVTGDRRNLADDCCPLGIRSHHAIDSTPLQGSFAMMLWFKTALVTLLGSGGGWCLGGCG